MCPPGFGNLGRGVLRQYILVKHDNIIKVPDHISLKDAAFFMTTCMRIITLFVQYVFLCSSNFQVTPHIFFLS
jgi:NADPH:quinone reductase-like Zn-dependent oxidoreductase